MKAAPLRLSLQCVGGFTGPAGAQTRSVDVACLPVHEADRVRALVAGLDLPSLPPSLLKPRPQPWDFLYTLTVDDGSARTVRFHADSAPPALQELVATLEQQPPDVA